MLRRLVQSVVLSLCCFGYSSTLWAKDDLSGLLSRFQSVHDLAPKEALLQAITKAYPDSGPALLAIARNNPDVDTKWLAIRGIGYLKFRTAVPFLKESLTSNAHFVRANAARALGEFRDTSAVPDLIRTLDREIDNGVIEQTALALEMIGDRRSVASLKLRADNPSPQTRLWILGAIELLGTKSDVPFFASFLEDRNTGVAEHAAHTIERFTGEDFGFPVCGSGPCVGGYSKGLLNAQKWWNDHKQDPF